MKKVFIFLTISLILTSFTNKYEEKKTENFTQTTTSCTTIDLTSSEYDQFFEDYENSLVAE
ncbi:MAG: hypothetical protein IJB86_07880 [Clostridia bacterium]|nr:hypothetical protein [Clostridia bacterium]